MRPNVRAWGGAIARERRDGGQVKMVHLHPTADRLGGTAGNAGGV